MKFTRHKIIAAFPDTMDQQTKTRKAYRMMLPVQGMYRMLTNLMDGTCTQAEHSTTVSFHPEQFPYAEAERLDYIEDQEVARKQVGETTMGSARSKYLTVDNGKQQDLGRLLTVEDNSSYMVANRQVLFRRSFGFGYTLVGTLPLYFVTK